MHVRIVSLFGILWCLVVASPAMADDASRIAPLGEPAPDVLLLDRTHLTRFTRRVINSYVKDGVTEEIDFVPSALADLRCPVGVTIRQAGQLIGSAESPEMRVMHACRTAAIKAVGQDRSQISIDVEDLPFLSVEVELVGPRQRIGTAATDSLALAGQYESAIHGISVVVDGREVLIRPSLLISKAIFCRPAGRLAHDCNRYAISIESLKSKLGLKTSPPSREPASVVFYRFRTTHLYEPARADQAVLLQAGMRIVDPKELSNAHLLHVVRDLARYIRDRQLEQGSFSYEYLPGRDMYWPGEQNWVRQAGTTWALALYARATDDRVAGEAAERAIDVFKKMCKPLASDPDARFVATDDGRHPLGATALFALALMDSPRRDQHEVLCGSLIRAIATLQLDNGSFATSFPPSTYRGSQDYFPGEALLALARYYAWQRDSRWRQVMDQALPYYQKYFRENRSPNFVCWQIQAWSALTRTTRLKKYADFVFEMADFAAEGQIQNFDRLPIYHGGFDLVGQGRAGSASLPFVEAFAAATKTAAVMNDDKRKARYKDIATAGARFVCQLRFKPQECYYVPSPEDVVGGIRNTPINPALRIDHCQHALAGLLGVLSIIDE